MNYKLSKEKIGVFLIMMIISRFFISCHPYKLEYEFSPVNLRFSSDTLSFDTLLSTTTSISKRFRVYNDNTKAISIASINISATSDAFTLIVNGKEGTTFNNIDLYAGDSMLILLKAHVKNKNKELPYIVEENLSFSTNGNTQKVKIIAWGQDAHFLHNLTLKGNAVWKKGRPYVIYNNLLVDSLSNLLIEPGTRVYSHAKSSIFIKGTLNVKGSAKLPVVFTDDQLDKAFNNIPGQWGGIEFWKGSSENTIEFAHIRNAKNGIFLNTVDQDDIPDLVIKNSIIENSSKSGILSFSSDLTLINCLIDNCVEFNIACLAGGNYIFNHTTIANFGAGFFRKQPALLLSNSFQKNDGSLILEDLKGSFTNNIIWGNREEEIRLTKSKDKLFDITFNNNIIRTSLIELEVDNIIEENPLFIKPYAYNYHLKDNSPAIDKGIDLGILIDLDSLQREDKPDIGAYEFIVD